jgi:hypothetical protein
MKNFPNSIKVIKPQGRGRLPEHVDHMGQTCKVRKVKSRMLNGRKHLGDLSVEETPCWNKY